mgnify:CR=1 FL=1
MPGGRPTNYDPTMCEKVIEYGKLGDCKAEIAVKLNVSTSTLYRWMDAHEEFWDAIKEAEKGAEAWYNRTFKTMAMGGYERANATALIFAAKNQLPNVFRDRRETELSGKVGLMEINFTGYDEEAEEAEASSWDE